METSVPPAHRWWSSGRPPRPGQLTPGWRLTTLATWVLAFLAWTAAWKTSRELGLSTWWLGPSAAPRPFPVLLLPFVPIVAMIAATMNNLRRLPWFGLAASAASAAIAIGDLDHVVRLAFVELGIAVATAAVSVASLSGTFRSPSSVSAQTTDDVVVADTEGATP